MDRDDLDRLPLLSAAELTDLFAAHFLAGGLATEAERGLARELVRRAWRVEQLEAELAHDRGGRRAA
jgi:hypothetical protein